MIPRFAAGYSRYSALGCERARSPGSCATYLVHGARCKASYSRRWYQWALVAPLANLVSVYTLNKCTQHRYATTTTTWCLVTTTFSVRLSTIFRTWNVMTIGFPSVLEISWRIRIGLLPQRQPAKKFAPGDLTYRYEAMDFFVRTCIYVYITYVHVYIINCKYVIYVIFLYSRQIWVSSIRCAYLAIRLLWEKKRKKKSNQPDIWSFIFVIRFTW